MFICINIIKDPIEYKWIEYKIINRDNKIEIENPKYSDKKITNMLDKFIKLER
jgi:hypothetical protein